MCITPVPLEPMILTQAAVNVQCLVSEGGGMTVAPRLVVWPCPTTTPSIPSAGSAARSPQSDWLVPQWWSERGDSNDRGISHVGVESPRTPGVWRNLGILWSPIVICITIPAIQKWNNDFSVYSLFTLLNRISQQKFTFIMTAVLWTEKIQKLSNVYF